MKSLATTTRTGPGSGSEAGEGNLRWWLVTAWIIFPGHVIANALAGTLRVEYVVLAAIFLVLVSIGAAGRRFSLVLFPFWLTGFVYEHFHYVEHLRGKIRVAELHAAELRWFGVEVDGVRRTIPELLQHHTAAVIDLVSGSAYIIYLWVPMLVAILAYRRDGSRSARIGLAFFIANILGMITYLVYPAAPPWYVQEHGLGPAVTDVIASPAGALRFDELTGLHFFQGWYGRSANVFGAMPSLHVAYPTAVFAACIGLGKRWSIPTGLFALVVAFSAVYLNHHYVLDVVIGALYGFGAHGLSVAMMLLLGRYYRVWESSPQPEPA